MKKILFNTTLFLILCGQAWSQSCQESQAKEYIENSDLKIMFRNGGDMFWDGTSAQYQVPYDYNSPTPSTIFAAAIWMGGYDSGGNLHLSAQTYRSNGNDFWAGPLDPSSGLPYTHSCSDFDQIWKVKRWAIERHLTDYNANNSIDNPIDPSLLQWPGRGNPHFYQQMGFHLPDQDLAPYFDQNNDAIYDPADGDYPVFEHGNPNAIAEEILWSVFNDNGNIHTQSMGQALKVEVQQTAYVFECSSDPVIGTTLFLKHKVISHNPLPIYDYYYGLWSDPDLGCSSDDYVGTLVNKNTLYTYNTDNNDDNPCGNGLLGYGQNPPVQAMTFLNQPLAKSMFYINQNNGNPSSAIAYYRVLDGHFANGTPLSYGGNGYNPNDTNAVQTDYIFPSNPNDFQGWSMASEGLTGYDTRMVGSIFKDSLMPGETFVVDIAFSYHRDLDSASYQNVNLMEQQIDVVQQFYDNGFPLTNCSQASFCTSNCVFPGDANNNGIANDFDILEMGLVYGQNAVTRSSIGDNWLPYMPPSPINNAYQDADGDGQVDSLDFAANTTNFFDLHSLYNNTQEGYDTPGLDLTFERNYPSFFIFALDTIPMAYGTVSIDVNFGDSLNQINDIHAITFRIEYDEEALIHQDQIIGTTIHGSAQLDAGWLDDDNAPTYARQLNYDGKLQYVATRLNQTNTTGGGNIGRLAFRVSPNAPYTTDTMSTQICFEDFKAIRADGTNIPIGAQCITIMYQDTTFVGTPIKQINAQAPTVLIYPNPAHQYINIDLAEERATSIQFYNLLGELVHEELNVTGITQVQKENWAQGMYTILINFENGAKSSHKFISN